MAREKILIAEDEKDVRDICVRVLSRQDYQVTAVESGLLAIEAASQEPFDILLTDIKMPRMDGLETAQKVMALHPDIVCIVMTGFGTMDTAIKALQLGIDEFLVKPFTPDMLTTAVAKVVEKVRLRRENIRLRALIPLFELSKTFLSAVASEGQLLHQVLEVAQQETRADKAALLLLSEDSQELAVCLGSDFDVEAIMGHELAIQVAQASEQRILTGLPGTTGPSSEWAEKIVRAGIQAAIITPLMSKAKPLGILIVAKSHPQDRFAASDAEMLSILCGQAAIAIENARLFKEIQLAYEELKELDRLKSEFINIAAHELRTPLAILMGHASLLAEELDGSAGERMETIVRNARHLRSLINDIVDLRQLEAGEMRLHLDQFNLGELIQTSIDDLRLLARDKRQTVEVLVEDGLPPIIADRQRLSLVLSNLVGNATKFTPEGGVITIRGSLEGNEVLISVHDNGIGIPTDALDKIFERFFQVEDSLTRQHEGIGLGLSIVKGIVELWGGRVWVESELGRGSTFMFTVPQPALSRPDEKLGRISRDVPMH